MLEPTLEWLVALVMLLTLSEECCLLMRRSGCWFCCWFCWFGGCCCWLPLLPAEDRHPEVGNGNVCLLVDDTSKPELSIFCMKVYKSRKAKGFNHFSELPPTAFQTSRSHVEKCFYDNRFRSSSSIPRPSAVFTVRLCLQCVCTCPVALGHEFRRVDDSVDGGLSHSVLLLQKLDGLPQLIQLGVLRAETVAD